MEAAHRNGGALGESRREAEVQAAVGTAREGERLARAKPHSSGLRAEKGKTNREGQADWNWEF